MRTVPLGARAAWVRVVAAGAVSAALFATSVWIPPLGFLLCLASPLPIALTAVRGGHGSAAVSGGSGALGALALVGPMGALVYASQFGAAGYALGSAAAARRSPHVTVGAYTIVAVAGFWGLLGVVAAGEGTGSWAMLRETLDRSVAAVSELLLQKNSAPEAALAIEAWAEETGRFLVASFPGLFGVLALLTGWLNALALRRIAPELRASDWSDWKAPESWIWVLIGSGLAALLGSGALGIVGLNVFIAAVGVYFLQGTVVIHHFFTAKRFPPLFRAAAYALLFFQLPVMLLVAGLGAFDLWLDFRARWSPAPTPGEQTGTDDSSESL